MKTIILRYALLFTICSSFSIAKAEEYALIDENFSSLYIWAGQRICGDWTLSAGCVSGFNVESSNIALRIEDILSPKKIVGYASTPKLGYAGDVDLIFDYARGKNSTISFDITIEGGGTFGEEENYSMTKTITVNSGNQRTTFHNTTLRIINATPNTTIKFSENALSNTFLIDNVKVITVIPRITINETDNNSETLEANLNHLRNVRIMRTLTGGIWNTLCLPFDVTMSNLEQALGTGQDVQLRTYTGYSDNVMAFTSETEIPAGTPFLIKLNTTVENPTFHAVTISDAPAAIVTYGDVSFVGTYSPVDLKTDGTELFITKNNTLSVPAATTNTMNGMRAYIRVPGTFNPSAARLAIDESTAIPAMNADRPGRSVAVYDLSGRQVAHPRRGLYIVDSRLTFIK
jgi:hypothetical protein